MSSRGGFVSHVRRVLFPADSDQNDENKQPLSGNTGGLGSFVNIGSGYQTTKASRRRHKRDRKQKEKHAGSRHVSVLVEQTSNHSNRPRPRHSKNLKNSRPTSVLAFPSQEQVKGAGTSLNIQKNAKSNRNHNEASVLANIGSEKDTLKQKQSVLMDISSIVDRPMMASKPLRDALPSNKRKATVLESLETRPERKKEALGILATLEMGSSSSAHSEPPKKVKASHSQCNKMGILGSLQPMTSFSQARKKSKLGVHRRSPTKSKRALTSDFLASTLLSVGNDSSSAKEQASGPTEIISPSPQQKKTRRRKTTRVIPVTSIVNGDPSETLGPQLQLKSNYPIDQPFKDKASNDTFSVLEKLGNEPYEEEADGTVPNTASANLQSTTTSIDGTSSSLQRKNSKEVTPLTSIESTTVGQGENTKTGYSDKELSISPKSSNSGDVSVLENQKNVFYEEEANETAITSASVNLQTANTLIADSKCCLVANSMKESSQLAEISSFTCTAEQDDAPKDYGRIEELSVESKGCRPADVSTTLSRTESCVLEISQKKCAAVKAEAAASAVASKNPKSLTPSDGFIMPPIASCVQEDSPVVHFVDLIGGENAATLKDGKRQKQNVNSSNVQRSAVPTTRSAMTHPATKITTNISSPAEDSSATIHTAATPSKIFDAALEVKDSKKLQLLTDGSGISFDHDNSTGSSRSTDNSVTQPCMATQRSGPGCRVLSVERPCMATQRSGPGCRVLSVESASPIPGVSFRILNEGAPDENSSYVKHPRRSSRTHVATNRLTVTWAEPTKARPRQLQEKMSNGEKTESSRNRKSRSAKKQNEVKALAKEKNEAEARQSGRVRKPAAQAVGQQGKNGKKLEKAKRSSMKATIDHQSSSDNQNDPIDLTASPFIGHSGAGRENEQKCKTREPDPPFNQNRKPGQSVDFISTLPSEEEPKAKAGEAKVVTEEKSIWTEDQVKGLAAAHRTVNPMSSSFWHDIAKHIEGKTAADCQEKWFSLVKTPQIRRKKSSKKHAGAIPTGMQSNHGNLSRRANSLDDDEDDDIFNSTPMRGGFLMGSTHFNLHPKDGHKHCDDDALDLGSPIRDQTQDVNHAINEYGDALQVEPIIQKRGYKKYLQGLKRGIAKANKEKKTSRSGQAKGQSTARILSEKEDGGEVALNARLSPGGTLRLKQLTEIDDEHMAYTTGSGEEYSDFED